MRSRHDGSSNGASPVNASSSSDFPSETQPRETQDGAAAGHRVPNVHPVPNARLGPSAHPDP
ncbi:hypothetical protein NJ76_00030 [Rhodococcus sp. IITR03]|nr:hypothetical protein NJ76_00030 [Rhodococcus sp. IITR03]